MEGVGWPAGGHRRRRRRRWCWSRARLPQGEGRWCGDFGGVVVVVLVVVVVVVMIGGDGELEEEEEMMLGWLEWRIWWRGW